MIWYYYFYCIPFFSCFFQNKTERQKQIKKGKNKLCLKRKGKKKEIITMKLFLSIYFYRSLFLSLSLSNYINNKSDEHTCCPRRAICTNYWSRTGCCMNLFSLAPRGDRQNIHVTRCIFFKEGIPTDEEIFALKTGRIIWSVLCISCTCVNFSSLLFSFQIFVLFIL